MAKLAKSLRHEDDKTAQALLKALDGIQNVEGFHHIELDGNSVVVDFDLTRAELHQDLATRANIDRQVSGAFLQDDVRKAAPIFRARIMPEIKDFN